MFIIAGEMLEWRWKQWRAEAVPLESEHELLHGAGDPGLGEKFGGVSRPPDSAGAATHTAGLIRLPK